MALDISYRDGETTSAKDLSRFARNFVRRAGVVPNSLGVLGDELRVVEAGTPDMSVDVNPGLCYFFASDGKNMREFENDAIVNVPIDAASHAGTETRIDVIVARENSGASIEVVKGTPATTGSETAPATPADSIKLAEVSIVGGDTAITQSQITDFRKLAKLVMSNPDGWDPLDESDFSYSSTTEITTAEDYTDRIQAGDKIKIVTASGTFYFFATAVTASAITVYGGTDYTVPNATFTQFSISRAKAPFGFPMDPAKWTVKYDMPVTNISTTSATYVQMGSVQISVPVGIWNIECYGSGGPRQTSSSTADLEAYLGLSTSTSSLTYEDTYSFYRLFTGTSSTNHRYFVPYYLRTRREITSTTTVYLVGKVGNANTNMFAAFSINPANTGVLRATIAYL